MATDKLTDRPWLLLPGTLCTDAVFDTFLDALGVARANRHYVELDRPDVEDYRDVFEQVTPETVVCGFSLGAIVTAHACDQITPDCLILFGLNPFADEPSKADGRHALARDVHRSGGGAALRARPLDINGKTPDTTCKAIFEMAEQTAHLIDAQTQLALMRPGAVSALAGCKVPVFCLTGSRDSAAPPEQGRAAADSAPNGWFYELGELGHFALLEDPDTCAKAVRILHESRHGPA